MKRSWTALAVALAAISAVAGCNDYGNTFQTFTGATITFLSPSQISAGASDFTLTINGGGFVAKTVVQWNGKTIPTTVTTNSAGGVTSVTATVAAALVAKPGIATVSTLNPASGAGNNGLSNPIAFVINPPPNPIPALTSVTPNTSAASTSTSQTLTISLAGSNFLPNSDPTQASQVLWSIGGTQTRLATGTMDASHISATVTGDLFANTGSMSLKASVTVFNPPSPPPPGCTSVCNGGGGGGPSAAVIFTICAAGQSSCSPLAVVKSASATTEIVAEETPAVSLDGRYVAYTALYDEHAQVFLRDTCEGATVGCQPRSALLSVASDGSAANDESRMPSMSSDGRFIAFSSVATNLLDTAAPGRQVYLRDTCAGAGESCKPSTQLISADSNGALVGTESILPSVSSSGRFVAFLAITPSHASDQTSANAKTPANGKNSGYRQVFIRDTCLGAANCSPKTTRISLQPGDGTGTNAKPAGPALSGNAKHIAIAPGNAATLFTHAIAVDDGVFLAITSDQH